MNGTFTFFVFVSLCYLLGCFSTGYYLVRFAAGADIRDAGSNSTGATNVGRRLGTAGFLTTLIVDILKGMCVALLCEYFSFSDISSLVCCVAVTAGHIWPVQLRFRGGKGIAVSLGFLVVWNPVMLLIVGVVTALAFAAVRRFTIAGLTGFLSLPVSGFIYQYNSIVVLLIALWTAMLFFVHSEHIKDFIHHTKNDNG